MSLSQNQIPKLLASYAWFCPLGIAEEIVKRSNGELSERFVPLALHLKEHETTYDVEARVKVTPAKESLFGCKVRFSSDNDFYKLEAAALKLGQKIGKRYARCSFDEFVADIKNIISCYSRTPAGLNTTKFVCAIENSRYPFRGSSQQILEIEEAYEAKERERSRRAMKEMSNHEQSQEAASDTSDNQEPTYFSDGSISVSHLREFGGHDVQEFMDNCAYIIEAQLRMKESRIDSGGKPLVDERVMLAALAGCNGFSRACSALFGITDFRIKFPDIITSYRNACMEQVDRRTVPSKGKDTRGGSKDFFTYAKEKHGLKLIFDETVASILMAITRERNDKIEFDLSKESLLDTFLMPEQSVSEELKGHVPLFREFLKINDLEQKKSPYSLIKSAAAFIRKNVIGQSAATDSVTSHLSGLIKNGGQKHLGVSTFFGVSGTGKTHMAESICEVFNQQLKAGFQIISFNMEQYSDERDVMRLFGSGVQYTDSALGALMLPVIKNPRTIFIFDEIEKAHPAVVQSLLTPIEKGRATDATSEMNIDMSQCLFIFTTNLGSKSIEGANDCITFDPKELLTEKENIADRTFSSEMVNRLTAGNIAIFKSLRTRDLLHIAEKQRSQGENKGNLQPPSNQSEVILATLGSNVCPRTIATQWEQLEGRITRELIELLPDNELYKLDNMRFSSKPVIEDNSLLNITIFSNSCTSDLKHFNAVIAADTSLQAIEQALMSESATLLIDEAYLTADQMQLKGLLKQYPEKVVFSCASVSSPSLLKPLVETGHIFQHHDIHGDVNENIHSLLKHIQSQIYLIAHTHKAINRNIRSDYEFSYDIQEDGVEVSIGSINHKYQVRSEDTRLPFLQFAEHPQCDLSDVIGMDKEKAQFKVIIDGLKNEKSKRIPIPNGYLLTGMPGTGKTHLARCVAGESELFFFGVNAADLAIGDAVSNINKLFEVANRYAPSIMFIDEIEVIGKDRAATGFTSNNAVNALLTAMDGFAQQENKVFVLAATNYPEVLDKALKRPGRLDKSIQFHPPCDKGRRDCIRRWFNDRGEALTLPCEDELVRSTNGATVDDIRSIFDDSMLSAAAQEQNWKSHLLKEAIRTRRYGALNERVELPKEKRVLVAYHEAGHLVAHRLLFPDVKVALVSIQPRAGSLGMVVTEQSGHSYSFSIGSVKAQIQVLLAGIVAEQLRGVTGDQQESGSIDDREKATQLAKDAIENWGMSDKYGLAIPKQLKIEPASINDEVVKWLSDAHSEVTKLLKTNKPLLDRVATTLLKEEVLEENTIDLLFEPIAEWLAI